MESTQSVSEHTQRSINEENTTTSSNDTSEMNSDVSNSMIPTQSENRASVPEHAQETVHVQNSTTSSNDTPAMNSYYSKMMPTQLENRASVPELAQGTANVQNSTTSSNDTPAMNSDYSKMMPTQLENRASVPKLAQGTVNEENTTTCSNDTSAMNSDVSNKTTPTQSENRASDPERAQETAHEQISATFSNNTSAMVSDVNEENTTTCSNDTLAMNSDVSNKTTPTQSEICASDPEHAQETAHEQISATFSNRNTSAMVSDVSIEMTPTQSKNHASVLEHAQETINKENSITCSNSTIVIDVSNNDTGPRSDENRQASGDAYPSPVDENENDPEQSQTVIKLSDLEHDMTEISPRSESFMMADSRNQNMCDSDGIPSPVRCPIFRTKLGGATVTECGHCFCTHCYYHRENSLDKPCMSCERTIGSHRTVDMDMGSEDLIRSAFLKIEKLKENNKVQMQQIQTYKEEIANEETKNRSLRKKNKEQMQKIKEYQEEIKNERIKNQRLTENNKKQKQKINKYMEEIAKEQAKSHRLTDELTETNRKLLLLSGENENLTKMKTFYAEQTKQLHSQLKNFNENILSCKENDIKRLQNEVAVLSRSLHQKQEETGKLECNIQELNGHLHQKQEETEQLVCNIQELTESLHQKQEETGQLKNTIKELWDEVTMFKRETVRIDLLEVIPRTNLGRAIQELQHFYDREYRSRYDITDKMEVLLQTRLEVVMNELCQQPHLGDQLASVITTYTSMVKENANLHRCVRANQNKIQDLQAELRHTKARITSTRQPVYYR